MRRVLLVLLALLAVVVGVALATSSSEPPRQGSAADPEAEMLVFSVSEPLLVRVDAAHVIPAQSATVFARRQGDELESLVLRFAMDRAETLKLRPPAFDMEVDAETLLSMNPDLPVHVTAEAGPELLKQVQGRLAQGASLAELASETDFSGFPMLYNLESYRFKGLTQEEVRP